ncbi:MAG TPA: hypothetical protein VFM18_17795 [Methanosarcina sp.]|nr:hypothetical protein [Methanosarcina sp.]
MHIAVLHDNKIVISPYTISGPKRYLAEFHPERGLFRLGNYNPVSGNFSERIVARETIDHFSKCIGVRLFDDGFFVSDADKTLFLLKFQGLSEEMVFENSLL